MKEKARDNVRCTLWLFYSCIPITWLSTLHFDFLFNFRYRPKLIDKFLFLKMYTTSVFEYFLVNFRFFTGCGQLSFTKSWWNLILHAWWLDEKASLTRTLVVSHPHSCFNTWAAVNVVNGRWGQNLTRRSSEVAALLRSAAEVSTEFLKLHPWMFLTERCTYCFSLSLFLAFLLVFRALYSYDSLTITHRSNTSYHWLPFLFETGGVGCRNNCGQTITYTVLPNNVGLNPTHVRVISSFLA